ncbi:thioredoxin domain-containing protein [Thermocatellispora tengchongensis]|uniref:hypothetical protein n=1 Tax=Thermocatellispora tengchongensis TaxID=1073253 RepID=UPI00362DA9BA
MHPRFLPVRPRAAAGVPGEFDNARPSNDVAVTGASLRAAVDAVLAGTTPEGPQQPSLGCGIKWKPGNEPA